MHTMLSVLQEPMQQEEFPIIYYSRYCHRELSHLLYLLFSLSIVRFIDIRIFAISIDYTQALSCPFFYSSLDAHCFIRSHLFYPG